MELELLDKAFKIWSEENKIVDAPDDPSILCFWNVVYAKF